MKPTVILAGAALVLAGLIGLPHLNKCRADPEIAATGQLVAPPPKETFSPVFAPCAHCHQIGSGARNSTGPVLTGVINRPAASTSYPYSAAMRDSGVVWDETTLRAFLSNPHKLVPGTRMAFAGLKETDITELLNFIHAVKSAQ